MSVVTKTIYNKATGQIRCNIFCPPEMVEHQYDPETEGILDGEIDDSRYYIVNGEPVEIPPRPSEHHTFDWSTHTWVDPRTLADLKNAKWEEIKHERNRVEFGGFEWDGSWFDSDRLSQSRIQGAAQLAQLTPDFSIDWTLADNSVRTLDAEQMVAVGLALGLHVNAAHAHARAIRAQIEAATTAEAVNAITW